jgi:hypothetical protein
VVKKQEVDSRQSSARHLAFSSTLEMEVTSSSVTSVHFQRILQRYIPEDITIVLTDYLEFQFQNGSFKIISTILVSFSALANRILFA